MNAKCFELRVKVGTRIFSSRGDYTIEEVPQDAWERFQEGSTWLKLSSEAVEELKNLSEAEVRKLLILREKQGFDDDVKIIEKALKSKASKSKGETKKSS